LEGKRKPPPRHSLKCRFQFQSNTRPVGNKPRKKTKSLGMEVNQPCVFHRSEQQSTPHSNNTSVPLPRHPGRQEDLKIVQGIEGVWFQKHQTSAGPEQCPARSETSFGIMDMMQDKESDDHIESTREIGRKPNDVALI
jgi:hypothetical protein